jgi:hypothetical protein
MKKLEAVLKTRKKRKTKKFFGVRKHFLQIKKKLNPLFSGLLRGSSSAAADEERK